MVPRKFHERFCFPREGGHFGNKEFRTTPIYRQVENDRDTGTEIGIEREIDGYMDG